MEKRNKIFITLTLFIIVVAVLGLTIYKVVDDHNEKLLHVKSEYINIPADTQYINVWFRRINNIYELHIAETEASSS